MRITPVNDRHLRAVVQRYNYTNRQEQEMKITYSIWQGSRLLSIDNTANSPKEIDALITALNDSELGKKTKFTANVQTIQANN
jgi:hypothetical protein